MLKNNLIKISAILVFIVLISVVFSSCNVGYTEDEIKDECQKLVEASYIVNDIYFGHGLPIDEKNQAFQNYLESLEGKEQIDEADLDIASVKYWKVDENSGFTNINQLKDAALAVYTESYCNSFFVIAFEGLSNDDDTSKIKYARYIENEYYELCQRSDINESETELNRKYDFSSMKITSMKNNECKISIDSLINGEKDLTIELTLKLENGNWRLDTPTY